MIIVIALAMFFTGAIQAPVKSTCNCQTIDTIPRDTVQLFMQHYKKKIDESIRPRLRTADSLSRLVDSLAYEVAKAEERFKKKDFSGQIYGGRPAE